MNVVYPDFVKTWPAEIAYGELEHSKSLLEVSIVPDEICKVHQHNWRQTTMLLTALVSHFGCLEGTDAQLQVDIQLP